MSDLAIVDVQSAAQVATGKSYAIVGPFRARDAGSDATLSALINAMPSPPVVVAGPATNAHAENVVDVRNRRLVARSVADVEAIIVVAPTFSAGASASAQLARMASRAKLRGQIVAFLGAGAESPNGSVSRWATRTAAHNADLTILRDELSADQLVAAGVEPPLRIGADPAWIELGELFAAPGQNDNVVVALDDCDSQAGVSQLAHALGPIAASGFQVVLQPWRRNHTPSKMFAEMVASRIVNNVSIVEAPETMREARDLYSMSRAVLSLRYHAVMAAAAAGTPTVVFGGRAMEQLGKTLEVPVIAPQSGTEEIAKTVMHTLEHGSAGSRVVPHLIDRAKASVDLVRLLLSEGEDTSQSANNPLPFYPNPWR